MKRVQIEESWERAIGPAFEKESFLQLRNFLYQQKQAGKIIFPPGPEIFAAFNLTPFNHVKVVILGQDPYHGAGQLHGLSFSVQDGVPFPPSLLNIFKALKLDLGISDLPRSGNLTKWARQGVLLLNATLTVEQGMAGSHQKKGWETFTDEVIHQLSEQREHLVFMLWGNFAQSKSSLINTEKHLVLKAPHPSPLSAHAGFFECKHFSKANQYLSTNGLTPIDWQL